MRFDLTPEDRKAFSYCMDKSFVLAPVPLENGHYKISRTVNGLEKIGSIEYEDQECWNKIFQMYRAKYDERKRD